MSQYRHRNETKIPQSCLLHGLPTLPTQFRWKALPWALSPAELPQSGSGHLLKCELGRFRAESHSPPIPPREVGLTFQMLDDAPQAVPVSSDEHPLAGLDLGDDLLIPEGQGPGDGVLEALTGGQFPSLQACVPAILGVSTAQLTSPAAGPPPGRPFPRPLTPGLPSGTLSGPPC